MMQETNFSTLTMPTERVSSPVTPAASMDFESLDIGARQSLIIAVFANPQFRDNPSPENWEFDLTHAEDPHEKQMIMQRMTTEDPIQKITDSQIIPIVEKFPSVFDSEENPLSIYRQIRQHELWPVMKNILKITLKQQEADMNLENKNLYTTDNREDIYELYPEQAAQLLKDFVKMEGQNNIIDFKDYLLDYIDREFEKFEILETDPNLINRAVDEIALTFFPQQAPWEEAWKALEKEAIDWKVTRKMTETMIGKTRADLHEEHIITAPSQAVIKRRELEKQDTKKVKVPISGIESPFGILQKVFSLFSKS